jgi:hypothetical protein
MSRQHGMLRHPRTVSIREDPFLNQHMPVIR